MRFVIGAVALLVLGSVFGSLAGMLFWPDLSYATSSARGMRLERDNMFRHTAPPFKPSLNLQSHPKRVLC
jgi:hypothetical protein